MSNKTPVFLVTLKNSKREKIIRKRLNFLKVNYKVFYCIGGENPDKHKLLDSLSTQKKAINLYGRPLTYKDISNAECHLRIYKYILRNKIFNAIVMEDDSYPSKIFSDWLKLSNFFRNKKYDIIHLYHNFGLAYKNSHKLISGKFSLYKTCYTLPYTTCYQISQKACKYILAKNKVISRKSDWPVDFYKTNLKQFAVLPYLTSVIYNHVNTSLEPELWKRFYIIERIKKFIPFYNLLTSLYYLSHMPFILGIHKNYSYYKEKFLTKKIFYIQSIFFDNFINLEKTLKDKSFYPKDLVKNAKKMFYI